MRRRGLIIERGPPAARDDWALAYGVDTLDLANCTTRYGTSDITAFGLLHR